MTMKEIHLCFAGYCRLYTLQIWHIPDTFKCVSTLNLQQFTFFLLKRGTFKDDNFGKCFSCISQRAQKHPLMTMRLTKPFYICWKSYLALCLHRICFVKADVVPDLSKMCLVPVQNLHFALCFLFPAAWSSYSLWFSYPNLIIAESLDILKKSDDLVGM